MKKWSDSGFSAVPFDNVTLGRGFLATRNEANRAGTIPSVYARFRETGRIDAFRLQWKPGETPEPNCAWDSDVAKWIEGASYSLMTHPDPHLEEMLDEVVDLVTAAQQPDGYLNLYYTLVEPDGRWTNLRDMHELYCAGHLIEAGIAHAMATGSRKLLDTMEHYVAYIGRIFGTREGQKRGYCGHEEIELALIRLYAFTGQGRYLELAEYFVEERGRQPHYFDQEALSRGDDPKDYWAKTYAYCQAHLPVREQHEAVGHAVRAMYLYSAMADLARYRQDHSLFEACRTLWDDLASGKLYLTGGIGSSRSNEGFAQAWDLPNQSAYSETCASIGLVYWSHRMLLMDMDSRYADTMERAIYNGVSAAVSLDGRRFNYVNPLASDGQHHREEMFGCACCPPNIARLFASVAGYFYSQGSNSVAVHLYEDSVVKLSLHGEDDLALKQETKYPWDGNVKLTVECASEVCFELLLRIPGWCERHTLSVNGEVIRAETRAGYAVLLRTWRSGDVIELAMEMPARKIAAHPFVEEDRGCLALTRGPIVYCIEQADHTADIRVLRLGSDTEFTPRYQPGLLGGVVVLEGEGTALDMKQWEGNLYLPESKLDKSPTRLKAIPYAAWDNREAGAMRVWIPKD